MIVKRHKDIEELKKQLKALEDRTRPPAPLPIPPPSGQEGVGARPPAAVASRGDGAGAAVDSGETVAPPAQGAQDEEGGVYL